MVIIGEEIKQFEEYKVIIILKDTENYDTT